MIYCFIALFAFAIFKVIAPLFSNIQLVDSNQIDHGSNSNQLNLRKQKLLESYQDLEFDKSTQKISEEDYLEQKNILLSEIKEIYVALDSSS